MVAPCRDPILGIVEVAGEIYLLTSVGEEGCYEVIRMADHYSVGTIGTSTSRGTWSGLSCAWSP